jgi:hypothetical protein
MGLPSCKRSHTSPMVRIKRPKIHAFRNRASGFSILRFPASVNLQLATSRDSTEELPLDPGLFVTLDAYESTPGKSGYRTSGSADPALVR